MKKGFKLLLLFSILLFSLSYFISTANARSGCCSYHGGVCCSCGPQANGKVICNDGWLGSSCYYSEMVMCQGYTTTPTCPLFSSYNSLTGSCECDYGYIAYGGECISTNQYCNKILGYNSKYNSLTNKCECLYGYILDTSGKCTYADFVCHDKYGYHSRYESLYNTCECSYGYVFNLAGTKCISEDEACQEQFGFGAKATISGDKCECKSGYRWAGGKCALDTSIYDTSDSDDYYVIEPSPLPTKVPSPKPSPKPIPSSTPNPEPTVAGAKKEAKIPTPSPFPNPDVATAGSKITKGFFAGVALFIGWIFYRYRFVIAERLRKMRLKKRV